MVDVIIAVAAKVAELLVVPIGKHIIYPFKYKSNMEELTKQVEKLTNRRDTVQHSVDEAKRQGDEIEKHVEKWMHSVDEFTKGVVKPIIDDQVKAGKLCSIGFCPNLMARYSLSRKAAKTTEKGVHLLGEGTFEKVSYRPLLQKTTSIYVRGYEDFDSRNRVFNDLMKALTEAKFNLIGVYGMGGVGKTTLVKRVIAQAIQDKLFDEVVMAEVTETPDIKNIQGQIADKLGLTFQEESLSGRADRLRDRLKKEKRLLLVLDNIWAKLDLDAVGIPLGEEEEKRSSLQADQNGRNDKQRQGKILFTSRNLHVLRDGMNTQKNFFIEILSVEEAEKLFWKIVGHSEEKLDLNPIAVEIVERCAGLPVAIATIASALKNKSLSVWNNALDQLRTSNPRNIEGMHANVYSAIELSYNFLEREEAKSLFLLCGLTAPSGLIRNHELFKYAIGWGLFQDVHTMEQGRNKLHTLIDSLKASCLLLENDYGHSSQIKMHDIIHAVAVSIASTKKLMFNIRTATRLKEMLEEKLHRDATAVSLPYVQEDICELPERLELPKLELLYLCKKDLNLLQISDTFFGGVKELKVLNLTKFHLSSLPSSLQLLTNLQTLCLCYCVLGDIASIGYLTKLEVLSLASSDIEQLPEQIRQLTRLRYLDMSGCSKLKTITPGVISSLTTLEELYLDDSFVQWDVNGQTNASLTELKQLAHLTALEIHIPDVHIMPQDLFSRKLDRYIIIIGDVWGWFGNCFETSKTLMLKWSNIIYLGNGIKTLLNRTEDLYLDELKGVKNILYELDEEGFPQLKHLHVQNGLEVQDIINSDRSGPSTFFPKLESLFLRNLIKLEKICNGQLAIESFSKLRIVKVEKCDRLKHLFSFSMAKNLLQLEEIEAIDCKKLEEIVFNNSDKQFHQNGRTEFTRLRTLRLQCLPQLTSFGFNAFTPEIGSQEILAEDELGGFMPSFSQNVLLPNLEKLKLSSINIECLWLDQLPEMSSCCQTLTSLTLEECNNLKFLFSYSVVQSLVQLQKLKVRNCKSIEGVINSEELRGEGNVIKMVFPKLINLQLKGLPKLSRFGSGNSVEFLSLTQISIEDCPKLKTFFSDIKKSKEVEEMNFQDDIHLLFDEKVMLPTLASINLSSIPIRTIWHNQLQPMSPCFQNLKEIIMDGCDTVKYGLPSSMVESLVQLQVLEISNCKLMEVVTITAGERINNTLFTKLHRLHLKHLPELTTFCNFAGKLIELTSLAELWLENCPKMHAFVSNSPGAYMPAANEEQMNSVKNLHSHIQPFFDEKVGLPNLEFLALDKMDKLRKIWHHQLSSNSFCKLNFLGVQNCHNVLNVFPSNMFGRLQKLEELWLTNCSSLYEIFELQASSCGKTQAITATQLEKLVLNDLPKLKHIWDVDSQGLLTCQNPISIQVKGCDSLKSIFPASVGRNLLQLEQLWIENCCVVEEIFAKEEQVDEAVPRFPRLTFLRLAELPRLRSFYPRVHISEWPVLKKLHVWKCDRIEIFVSNVLSFQVNQGESQQEKPMEQPLLLLDKVPFNNLESLALDWKWIEKESLHEKLPVYSCKLKVLTFVGFHNEANICVSCFLHKLPDLERLQVHQGFFKEIFSFKGFGCEEKHVEAPSKLSNLLLSDLFDSLHLWEESSLSSKVFQNLTILDVINCGNLKCLVPSSASFKNLTTLEVVKCDGLFNLVAAPTAKSMMQLTKLSVSDCERIEEIIIHEGDEVEDIIIFKKLSYLELQCLPSLTSFYFGNYITEFPSLEQLVVRECPNMKTFSRGVLRAPRLSRLQITETAEGKGYWKGNLNTTIEHLFSENGQSSKED